MTWRRCQTIYSFNFWSNPNSFFEVWLPIFQHGGNPELSFWNTRGLPIFWGVFT